jgi:hypothetical protein
MWINDVVRVFLILSIGIFGVGIMFSSAVVDRPIEEKAVFSLIGLFVTAIALLFLYLNKNVIYIFD